MKAVEYMLKAEKRPFNTLKIQRSADAVSFARNFYRDDLLIYESSFIILMNSCNRAIGYAKISQGGVCSTIVDPKIVAKYAVESLATGVIFIHNHPSGHPRPSNEDINTSKRLKEILKLMDVQLPDSIVITEDSYCSMADEGFL